MHGADWNAAKTTYESLLDYLVDDDELNTVMMMMIGQLNASHTGVTGGGPANDNRTVLQTRHPGFDLTADPSGFYKVTHIYKDGPADHDYLKIKKGDYLISVDDRDLKTSENYWQYFTLAAGTKFHFMVNDKPAKEGAWPVTIAPVAGGAFTDLQYARWVTDRREMVTKLSNGEIGYLHIRAMDAPSLRHSSSTSPPSARRRRSSSTSASTAAAASIRSCSASSPVASISTRSVVMPASSSRGRRTSTARWW